MNEEETVPPLYQTLADLQNRYLQEVDTILGSEESLSVRMDKWEEIYAMWETVESKLDWIKGKLQVEFRRVVVENCQQNRDSANM